MSIGAIIQARMGSTRLPGKVMKDISGKPMLWHVIDRVKRCNMLNRIVIASTPDKDNDVLEGLALANGIIFFRGPEEDVLNRFLLCAKEFEMELIVRITSDCPLIDPQTVDKTIKTHMDLNADYTSNILERTFPRGLDVEVFSTEILEKIDGLAVKTYQREHVTPYFYENPGEFRLINVKAEGKFRRPEIRLSVDTTEDLRFVKEIYRRLYKPPEIIDIEDVFKLIERNPELLIINKNVQQKRLRE